jgi:formate/nitrite transporter
MDYVSPKELMADVIEVAKRKADLSVRDLLLRGILAGGLLAYATSLVMVVLAQGLPPILGAALFPVGFVILVLLGFELVTGNFALLPPAALSGQVSWGKLVRNWTWVYTGNLIGSVLYAYLFYLAITNFGTSNGGPLGDQLRVLAQKKTLAYMAIGGRGWGTALVKGVLCNWMVTLGAVLALSSRSTIGKIVAMWLPIMTFFAHGYEHSVVNMYVMPAGMMLGAPVSMKAWWIWNQIPVTIGNILGGAFFTGIAMYVTYAVKPAVVKAKAEEKQELRGQMPAVAVSPADAS